MKQRNDVFDGVKSRLPVETLMSSSGGRRALSRLANLQSDDYVNELRQFIAEVARILLANGIDPKVTFDLCSVVLGAVLIETSSGGEHGLGAAESEGSIKSGKGYTKGGAGVGYIQLTDAGGTQHNAVMWWTDTILHGSAPSRGSASPVTVPYVRLMGRNNSDESATVGKWFTGNERRYAASVAAFILFKMEGGHDLKYLMDSYAGKDSVTVASYASSRMSTQIKRRTDKLYHSNRASDLLRCWFWTTINAPYKMSTTFIAYMDLIGRLIAERFLSEVLTLNSAMPAPDTVFEVRRASVALDEELKPSDPSDASGPARPRFSQVEVIKPNEASNTLSPFSSKLK